MLSITLNDMKKAIGLSPAIRGMLCLSSQKAVWSSAIFLSEYSSPARPKSDADLSENRTEIRFAKPPKYQIVGVPNPKKPASGAC